MGLIQNFDSEVFEVSERIRNGYKSRRGLLERAVRDGQTKLDGLRSMGVSRWQRTLDSRI